MSYKNQQDCKKNKQDWYLANKDKVKNNARKNRLNSRYGLTIEQYNMLLQQTNGICPICLTEFSGFNHRAVVDHCHTTGRVRGILCNGCNAAIGFLKDDTKVVQRALKWLEEK
jgi:hypothetical protein